jgi:hypothetical protein
MVKKEKTTNLKKYLININQKDYKKNMKFKKIKRKKIKINREN